MSESAVNRQELALCGTQPILHLTCGKCGSDVYRPGEDGRYECNGCGRNLDYFADEELPTESRGAKQSAASTPEGNRDLEEAICDDIEARHGSAATTPRFAEKPYPTGRTKATGREVIVCYCGDGTWPHEWRPNGGGARIFVCPSEAPIRKAAR